MLIGTIATLLMNTTSTVFCSAGDTFTIEPSPQSSARSNMDNDGYVKLDARHKSNRGAFTRLGRRFELQNPTLALDLVNGKLLAVTIPTGGMVEVASEPIIAGEQLIDVLWEGRTVRMFALDLRERGIQVEAQTAEAPAHSETTI